MKQTTCVMIRLLVSVSVLVAVAEVINAAQPGKKAAGAKIQRFRMNPFHVNIGRIASVKADGTVRVVDIANPRFALTRRVAGQVDLTEGYYLGLVADEFVLSTRDTRLVLVQVADVGTKGTATIRVSAAAAKNIATFEQIVFFRPPGSSTAELKAAPDFATVDDGKQTSVLGNKSVNFTKSLARSKNNLKYIGLAMHNFHDVHKTFPPAVVYGPDGKPWHSWRVLLLPFLDQAPLYNRYRFDEPWNGPNNKKLLSEMPELFRDPVYGETDDYYTHYAAVTGAGTAFPSQGFKMDPKQLTRPLININRSRGASRIRDITDGTSNSLLVGSVSPDRKIPWLKPEDVTFGKQFPALGQKGSFATPYEARGVKAGLFLYCDGSVRTIRADVDMKTLRNLLMIGDGNPIGEVPSFDAPRRRPRRSPGIKQVQVIEIIRTEKGVQARLVSKAIN